MQLQQEKQFAKYNLLRKCGLLAHTSAAFLKNCCTEKLFVLPTAEKLPPIRFGGNFFDFVLLLFHSILSSWFCWFSIYFRFYNCRTLSNLLNNALLRTFLDTKSAGTTFVIVNHSMLINDMNRIKFTDFFALLAANAGMLAGLHRCFSHILGRTEHIYLFLF